MELSCESILQGSAVVRQRLRAAGMVAQIRARRAPGLITERHEGVGVSWFFHEALARVFYRGCAGLGDEA